jgi:hypothetical protein
MKGHIPSLARQRSRPSARVGCPFQWNIGKARARIRLMGGIVALRSGKSWATTGYVFEQFLRHVIAQNKNDAPMVEHLESSICNQGLSFELVEDQDLERRLLAALRAAASDIVTNEAGRSVPGCDWDLSDKDFEIYLKSVDRLLRILGET